MHLCLVEIKATNYSRIFETSVKFLQDKKYSVIELVQKFWTRHTELLYDDDNNNSRISGKSVELKPDTLNCCMTVVSLDVLERAQPFGRSENTGPEILDQSHRISV
jgi:hypothetical protein